MGDFEASISVDVESSLEYHPVRVFVLTLNRYKIKKQIVNISYIFYLICIILVLYRFGDSAWWVV